MATLDELQAQLEELNRRVNEITAPPDDYYTHRFSGEEIDNAVGRVADTPGSGAITAGDVGAAPSGFGLGQECSPSFYNNPDDIKANGFFRTNVLESVLGSVFNGWCFGYHLEDVISPDNTYPAYQLFINQNGYCLVQRFRRNGVWSPFEWLNPPMQLGVEYLTTEKYNGKPVYVKNIDFGALPKASYKLVLVDNSADVIRVSGKTSDLRTLPGVVGVAQTGIVNCAGVGPQVQVVTYADQSSLTATVCAWYTKTTD